LGCGLGQDEVGQKWLKSSSIYDATHKNLKSKSSQLQKFS